MTATDTVASDSAKWLDKVTALLNKAESSEYPEEAELFTEKAAELMAKYAITEMMVEFNKGASEQTEEVIVVPYEVKMPYAKDRVRLLWLTSKAMGCNMYYIPVVRSRYGRQVKPTHHLQTRIVGFKTDVERVVQMYESLVAQEVTARAFALKGEEFLHLDGMTAGQKKVFNASFIRGFAQTASERVKKAYARAEKAAGGSVGLAVRNRAQKVADRLEKEGVRERKASWKEDHSGRAAGRQAGSQATINKEMR